MSGWCGDRKAWRFWRTGRKGMFGFLRWQWVRRLVLVLAGLFVVVVVVVVAVGVGRGIAAAAAAAAAVVVVVAVAAGRCCIDGRLQWDLEAEAAVVAAAVGEERRKSTLLC